MHTCLNMRSLKRLIAKQEVVLILQIWMIGFIVGLLMLVYLSQRLAHELALLEAQPKLDHC